MAIAFDASTTMSNTSSFSHTCTGTDRLLVVQIRTQISGGGDCVTGVTYNSVAMTRINTIRSETNNERGYLYQLVAPATGANTVTITTSGGPSVVAGATSYTGVAQSSPIDTSGSLSQGSGTSISVSVTTTVDNDWLVGCGDGVTGAGSNFTPGSNTTERSEFDRNFVFDSNGPQTPTGSYSQNYSWTGSERTYMLVAAIKPAASASGPANLKSYNTNLKANIKSINTNVIANVKSLDTNV